MALDLVPSDPQSLVEIDNWPHPVTSEGRAAVIGVAGQTLAEVLNPIVPPGIHAVAIVDGRIVSRQLWGEVALREGMVVQARVIVGGGGGGGGSNPIQAILSIAVLIAAPYLAPALLGGLGITATATALQLATAAIGFVGRLVVSSLFAPREPTPTARRVDPGQPSRQYTLSGGSNQVRAYRPLPLLLGRHRMFPDLVAQPYTEFNADSDQFLNQIFDFGLGDDLFVSNYRIGETDLSSYDEVTTQTGVNKITIVSGNVDTYPGGALDDTGDTVTRTTAPGVNRVGVDLQIQAFWVHDDGRIMGYRTFFRFEYRKTGTASWTRKSIQITTPDGAESKNPSRRSFVYDVPKGKYDVRCSLRTTFNDGLTVKETLAANPRLTFVTSVVAFRGYQPDTADFMARRPFAIRIKATGQLFGRLERINGDATQRIEAWNGSSWVVSETSNPAWIFRKYLQGWRRRGDLIAGMGLLAARINEDEIKAWGAFCTAEGLECNVIIDDGRDHAAALRLICQCGWASVSKASGRWGVIWEKDRTPVQAVFSPANIVAGTVSVTYENEGLADEIVGTYVDRDSGYEENTLRRTVPGVGTPERPIVIPLEGITDGGQAAKEINRTAAGQFYHARSIVFEAWLDGAYVARGDVIGASHDLVGGSRGGRVLSIDASRTNLRLSPMVESAGVIWFWCLDGTVHSTTFSARSYPSNIVTIDSPLPDTPRGILDDPLAYKWMAFSSAADLRKLRVVGIEPVGLSKYRITCRDELDAYYDVRTSDLTSSLIPGRNLPQDFVGNPDIVGSDGEDGVNAGGQEHVFAVTADPTISIAQRPDDDWGFDEPVIMGGLQWYDGAPSLTELATFLWRSSRKVFGQPKVGADVNALFGMPTIVGRYGLDGQPGLEGVEGADGSDGIVGEDGRAREYVFARNGSSSLSRSQRPSNAWGYDNPRSAGGLQWYDGAPNLTSRLSYLWRAERVVDGAPAFNAAIPALWTNFSVVGRYGDDGIDGDDGEDGLDGLDGSDANLPSGIYDSLNLIPVTALDVTLRIATQRENTATISRTQIYNMASGNTASDGTRTLNVSYFIEKRVYFVPTGGGK